VKLTVATRLARRAALLDQPPCDTLCVWDERLVELSDATRGPWPKDRPVEIDDVDLDLLDDDIHGVASSYEWNQDRLTAEHQEVLISCLAELDRVWPKIPQHARAFFTAQRELANYLLTTRGARTSE
jgi:hypothetical protein